MRSILPGILSGLGAVVAAARGGLLRHLWRMDVGAGCRVSLSAAIDRTNPRGVHVGDYTYVSSGADISAYDSIHDQNADTWIGERCHIGLLSVIYPGVRIGDGCIVAPGAVVTRDVPAGCLVSGHPARVIEKNIQTGRYGLRLDAVDLDRFDPPAAAPEQREARDKVGAVS